MMRKAAPGNILIVIILVVSAVIIATIFYKSSDNNYLPKTSPSKTPTPSNLTTNEYTSKDLKISFKYPKDWYVDEKEYDIMITSYKTRIGENKFPNENEIKIFIDNFSGCFPTLEEDLIDPACGQGEVKNKIVSKEAKQASGGEFLKYTIDSLDENQRIQYFFRNDEKILDIEKNPDPSQFEKEFEEIINSIEFL